MARKPDDFIPDNATTPRGRRVALTRCLRLSWAGKDIKKTERIVKNELEGWAMWLRSGSPGAGGGS
jgi:hypothetical protein